MTNVAENFPFTSIPPGSVYSTIALTKHPVEDYVLTIRNTFIMTRIIKVDSSRSLLY